jgi:hypothetical protein
MMGYRSEVAIAFYTHEPEHNGVVSLWLKSNFPFDDWGIADRTITEESNPNYSFVFHVHDIKWYEGYPAVERMNKLIEDFAELFCGGLSPVAACEFMRSGESDDDIESEQYGDVDHVLSITKSISVNI